MGVRGSQGGIGVLGAVSVEEPVAGWVRGESDGRAATFGVVGFESCRAATVTPTPMPTPAARTALP